MTGAATGCGSGWSARTRFEAPGGVQNHVLGTGALSAPDGPRAVRCWLPATLDGLAAGIGWS